MRQHLVHFLTESDDVIAGLHLDIHQQAVTYPVLAEPLDVFGHGLVAPLDGGDIFQTDGLAGDGVRENDLLT